MGNSKRRRKRATDSCSADVNVCIQVCDVLLLCFCLHCASALHKQTLADYTTRYNYSSCRADHHISSSTTHLHIDDTSHTCNHCFCSGCHSTLNLIKQAAGGFHMADLREIFDQRQNGRPPRNQPPPFELPNERIEVTVQLMKHVNSILVALQNDLNQHNMDTVIPDQARNSITVSGTPTVNGFDRHTVLILVQRRDPAATILE